MTDLTFYTNPMSRGRIVRWMLEEVGEPYETVVLDYGTTMKGADYLAINPMGKVPAIRHGDTVVTEAAAICAYLADAFPDKRPRPAARATASAALIIAGCSSPPGPVEAAVTNKALEVCSRPRTRRRSAAMAASTTAIDALELRSRPAPIFAASSSPPPTSMSARRSAGG